MSAGLYRTENRPGLHMLRRSFASHALKHTDTEAVRELCGGQLELIPAVNACPDWARAVAQMLRDARIDPAHANVVDN